MIASPTNSVKAALTRVTREAYRREIGYRVVAKHLAPHLAESATPRLAARMFERRWDALRALPRHRLRAAWIFDGLGGAPQAAREKMRARVLLSSLDVRERWEEVATHLGELLVVLTEDLPAHLPHARKILGDICFDSGARYAERVKSAFAIPDQPPDPRRPRWRSCA